MTEKPELALVKEMQKMANQTKRKGKPKKGLFFTTLEKFFEEQEEEKKQKQKKRF